MNKRALVVITVATAVTSLHLLSAPARANDRSALHHCEDVVAHAAKAERSATTSLSGTAEVERCRILVRESALRDSRMTVDENGRQMR